MYDARTDTDATHAFPLSTALLSSCTTWPSRWAITDAKRQISYAELDELSAHFASELASRGIGPGDVIAIHMPPCVEQIIAILSTIRANAAYVPVDYYGASDRTALILADASPRAVFELTEERADSMALDGSVRLRLRILPGQPNTQRSAPENTAYVIYTSGTTGPPKGVPITHDQLLSLFRATESYFEFRADDVWLMHHSAAFDFSVWEMWGALLHGARLYVPDHWLVRDPVNCARTVEHQGITVLNQTPTAFGSLAPRLLAAGQGSSLRYVIFGGERLRPGLLRPWIEQRGDERPELVNMYGITEVTVHATHHRIRGGEATSECSVIGDLLPGFDGEILDDQGESTSRGELWLSGPQVAAGYLNRPELTAERFRPLPGGRRRDPFYRTGDVVERLPDGRLTYLGRRDDQVKIRGYRIELGEVETAVAGVDGIADAAAVALDSPQGTILGCAYTTLPGVNHSPSILRKRLRVRLPTYMIPLRYAHIAEIPRDQNGKIERKKIRTILITKENSETP